MNINIQKRMDNSEYFNKKKNGKITEKFININYDNSKPKTKIEEYAIVLKNTKKKENNIKRFNNMVFNKISKSNKTQNNEPYLKPKFKNKNSFSIKGNNINDEMKNIYLNFFKIYYDENGKKVKIIKNKNNYKENKSKELVLTQNNNMFINNECKNKRKNKLTKNFTTEFFDIKNNNNKDNGIQSQYVYPEIPPKNEKKNDVELNKKINNNLNKKETNIDQKDTDYDSLPSFLKIRNQKINEKEYKKVNMDRKIVLNNTEKLSFLEKSLNKMKLINNNLSKNLLKIRHKTNEFNRNNNAQDISLNNLNENNLNNKTQKINYFHNDISNLTLNMTFEQNNITNTINNKNKNLKSLQFYSLKNKNIKKDKTKTNPLLINNFENTNSSTNTLNQRHSVGLQGNYILFNFFKDNYKDLNRNKSFGYNLKNNNYNSNYESRDSSIYEDSILSFNKNNRIKNNKLNYSNTLNDKEKEINILNKTKEILQIKDDKLNINNDKLRNTVINNAKSFFDVYPNSLINVKKNNSLDNMNYKNNINFPNISYYPNSYPISENKNFIHKNVNQTYFSLYNKNKIPCTLYMNKDSFDNDINKNKNIINNNNFSLNDYYNNIIDKNSLFNLNLNNNFRNNKNMEKNDIFEYKNRQKEIEINNDLDDTSFNDNIKTNLYDKKFLNLNFNQKNSTQQLFNKRLKNNNIFKFNRNKNKNNNNNYNNHSKKNSILDHIPSFIKINKTYN